MKHDVIDSETECVMKVVCMCKYFMDAWWHISVIILSNNINYFDLSDH